VQAGPAGTPPGRTQVVQHPQEQEHRPPPGLRTPQLGSLSQELASPGEGKLYQQNCGEAGEFEGK